MSNVANNDAFRKHIAKKKLGEESGWLEAILTHQSFGFRFAYILREGFSAMVLSDTKYENSKKPVELGDSVQIKIREILNNDPKHKTRHYATCARLCADFPENVIFENGNSRNSRSVFFETTARPFDIANDGKTILLHNEKFGCFVDMKHIVPPNCRSEITFEFYATFSPIDNRSSIFVPTRIIKIHEKLDFDRISNRGERNERADEWENRTKLYNSREHSELTMSWEEHARQREFEKKVKREFLADYDRRKELHSLLSALIDHPSMQRTTMKLDPDAYEAFERYIKLGP